MSVFESSRRKFLAGSVIGLSASWVAVKWSGAYGLPMPGTPTTFLTPLQVQDIDAMASQIFPTTDTPGAREARVVYFIDTALVTFAKDSQDLYTAGMADLTTRVHTVSPTAESFAQLTSDQQIQILTAIEKTPFFTAVRNHTIMGMFAAPQHGGNYQKVGWKLIGFDDSLNFQAPFGFYDRA